MKRKEFKQEIQTKKRRNFFSWVGKIFLIILLTLIFFAGTVILLYWKSNVVADTVQMYLNSKLAEKGKIKYGVISGSLLNTLNIDYLDFQLTDKLSLSTRNIKLTYDIWSALDEQFKINKIYIDSIDVLLLPPADETEQNSASEFNLDSLLYRLQNSHFMDSLFAKIPPFELGNFEIVTGHLRVLNKGLTFKNVHVLADAYFRATDFKFELVHLSGLWQEKDFKLDNLSFQILGSRDQITLNKLNMKTAQGTTYFNLAGDLEIEAMRLLLSIEDFNIDFDSFKQFTYDLDKSGSIHGSINLIGTPQNFSVHSVISGSWKHYELDELITEVTYNYGKILVEKISLKSSPGNIFLKANINPYSSARGRLIFEGINLNALDTAFAASNINGLVSINFPDGSFNINNLKKTLKKITGEGEIQVNNSVYGSARLDSLRFAYTAQKGDFSIKQPSFIKIANQARFELYGDLSRSGNIDIQMHTTFGDLNDLTAALGIDSVYGNYYTDFIATGQLENPVFEGFFRVNDFEYKDIYLDSMDFDMSLTDLFSIPIGAANFKIKKGSVYDIPVRDITLNAYKNKTGTIIPTARIFSDDNYIESSLVISDSASTTLINIKKLRMEYENYWLENQANIHISIDSAQAWLKNLQMSGPGNALFEATGKYDLIANDGQADLKLVNLNMEPFQQFIGEKHTVSGVLNGSAQLKDILTNPQIAVDISGDDIVYNNVLIGDFSTDLQYIDKKISIREFYLVSDTAKVAMEGDVNIAFDKNVYQIIDLIKNSQTNLKISWQNINLQKYNGLVKLKYPVRGWLNGNLEIIGNLDDPFMKQNLTLDNFKYNAYEIDSLKMFSQYSSGYLILDSLAGRFNGTVFSAKGYQQILLGIDDSDSSFSDNPFDFYISSSDKNITFVSLLNDQLESISGNYDFEVNINGTPEKPSIHSGKIYMEDGTVLLSRVKDPINNVHVDITIEDNLLTINEFEMKSQREQDLLQKSWAYISQLWSWLLPYENEKGVLDIAGTMDLKNALKPVMDIQIGLNEFYVDYFVENTKVAVTTNNLSLSGRDTLLAAGDLTIPYGQFEVNLDQIQKNVYMQDPNAAKEASNLSLALNLEIPGNFVVTSSALDVQNNFKIVLQGNLQANLSAGSNQLALIGALETESGNFSSYNQSFEVASGSINFSDPLKINPELDIIAEKRQQGNLFQLIITGNLEAIHQQIIVKNKDGEELNQLSMQDKMAMLTLGETLSSVTANSDSTMNTLAGVGEDVATNVMLNAAERGVENLTGLDRVQISSSDRVLDLQKLKLNNGLKQASISFGKYLTSDLYVEYRTQFGSGMPTPKLSWDAGNKISLQYRINKQWSVDSHYEKTIPQGNNKVQLGLSWEYTF